MKPLGNCLSKWTLSKLFTCTLNSAYNEKKYAEILLCYRWLFIKGNVFIGEWGIFDTEVFLHYSQFFIKGDFIIGRVECIFLGIFTEIQVIDLPGNMH